MHAQWRGRRVADNACHSFCELRGAQGSTGVSEREFECAAEGASRWQPRAPRDQHVADPALPNTAVAAKHGHTPARGHPRRTGSQRRRSSLALTQRGPSAASFPGLPPSSPCIAHELSVNDMGAVSSCCDSCCKFSLIRASCLPSTPVLTLASPPVRSRKSQSYEPLLLENEREAVADLLQFLESTTSSAVRRPRVRHAHPLLQTEPPPTSSRGHHFPR